MFPALYLDDQFVYSYASSIYYLNFSGYRLCSDIWDAPVTILLDKFLSIFKIFFFVFQLNSKVSVSSSTKQIQVGILTVIIWNI